MKEIDQNSVNDSINSDSEIDNSRKIDLDAILHVLSTLDLSVAFPNSYFSYKAYGTIPVSSSSAERSFFKVICDEYL